MPIKIDEEAFYKVKEVTEILEKSKEMVRRYCREGRIPGVKKVGREFIIPGWGLKEYLSTDRDERGK